MSALIDELYDFLAPAEATGDKPWQIEDQSAATWALRKISQIDRRLAEEEVLAAAEIDKIDRWIEGKREAANRERVYFEARLHEYLVALQAEDPKLKSLKLPGGTIRTRKQQPEYKYDDDMILPWAKKNLPAAVIVKESVNKSEIKAHHKDTGEVIPGLTVAEREPKFEVELEKEVKQPWKIQKGE